MGIPKELEQRVRRFAPEFIQDILDTVKRIDKKDGKAFGLRVYRSVSKRYKTWHYQIYQCLNWFEFRGVLVSRLESVEEFTERCKVHKGIFNRGKRRKYYKVNSELPSSKLGKVRGLTYKKLSYKDLGLEDNTLWDYPVELKES